MLNLFNLKERLFLKKKTCFSFLPKDGKQEKLTKTCKHFPSPLREWNNSIYVYNKNSENKLPSITNLINIVIKNYFNLYNKRLELKLRSKKLLLRFRRLTSNKLFVNNGGFKHTNNKVYINLYVFNRQKVNQILNIRNWFLKTICFTKNGKQKLFKPSSSINLIKRILIINKKGIENLISVNKQKYLLIKTLNTLNGKNKYYFRIHNFKYIIANTESFYKSLIHKSLRKIRMYYYYKQLIYLNKSKTNYAYLHHLTKYLEKIYNKNVEFNIFNIKKFYLNSNFLSESFSLKLTKNRRKVVRCLNKLKDKIKIISNNELDQIYDNNYLLNNTYFGLPLINYKKDNKNINNRLLLQKYIMNNVKYKYVTGFRLEVKGKLAKRFTVSRSMSKLVYKGNLLNIDSSYKGLSSTLLKGNLRSNTQYTSIRSKSRIGSFGIKGWISGN